MDLKIQSLCVNAFDKEILKGVDLNVCGGEIHAIMGPNGAGKSTLLSSIMGNPKFTIVSGSVLFDGQDILNMPVNERAKLGIFLSMQEPVEVPGVTNSSFIKTAVNAVRKEKVGVVDFIKELDKNVAKLQMRKDLPYRYVNDGFSGGEKKRNEMLQMIMLNPRLALLDEIDSGLDIDALKIVADVISEHRAKGTAIILITHYQRILDYIKPDFVHIMYDGKIVKTGKMELVKEIEEKGYEAVAKG